MQPTTICKADQLIHLMHLPCIRFPCRAAQLTCSNRSSLGHYNFINSSCVKTRCGK